MRKTPAHNAPAVPDTRVLCALALVFCAIFGVPAARAQTSDATTAPATQPAARAEAPRTRTPTTQPSTQPAEAAPPQAGPPAAATPTPAAPAAAPHGSGHMPEWSEMLGVVIVFGVLLSALIYAWKYSRDQALRKLAPDEDEQTFTLEELRQLRDSGQINQDEFLRARALVLERERRRMAEQSEKDESE